MEDLSKEQLEQWQESSGFKTIYNHYAPYVWRISYRMANGNKALAEEITQSVFVNLLKTMASFKFNSRFSTWLYTITYREALAVFRQRKKFWQRETPFVEESASLEESHDHIYEVEQELQQILKPLSTSDRFLLVSREIDGLSFEEIAQIMKKKSGALRTQLSRLKTEIAQGGVYELS